MTRPSSPKVFISYSHDSAEHKKRALALANRLRKEGITCFIDQYETSPPNGWPRWMMDQLDSADFIIAICTETYARRIVGREEAGKGLGADWEGALITQEIYDRKANDKFIPILFASEDEKHVPHFLRGVTRYLLEADRDYGTLYRHLTGQPAVVTPAIGSILPMPPEGLSEDAAYGTRSTDKKKTLR